MNAAPDTFHERLVRFENGDLSRAEFKELENELLCDPGKRSLLIDHFEQGQKLRTAFVQAEAADRIVPFSLASSSDKIPPPAHPWIPIALSSAAALVLFGVVWMKLLPSSPAIAGPSPETPAPTRSATTPNTPEVSPTLPHLVSVKGASWQGATPGPMGSPLTDGPWHLKSGIIRLEFANRSRATIEGPATFITTGSNVIELNSGQLTANHHRDPGITVIAQGKHIETGGTSLGVTARPEQGPEVCIFQGDMEIGRDRQGPIVLAAGSFTKSDNRLAPRVMSANQRLPFQRNLNVTYGLEDLDGTVLIFSSDIEHDLMEKEADGKAFLLPEQIVRIQGEVAVSMVGSGTLMKNRLEKTVPWQPTGPLRSFLLHANPSTRIEEQGSQSFHGSITFEHPIEAVIVSSDLLNRSDKLFAERPPASDGSGRGLEKEHGWEERARGRPVSDMVTVSEDRKTLTFSLMVGNKADQIRILSAGN